jgi:hypothetical protein
VPPIHFPNSPTNYVTDTYRRASCKSSLIMLYSFCTDKFYLMMNKLNLHNALFLFTGLLTGITLILYSNLTIGLKQELDASAMVAPTPTQTPGSPYEPTLNISFREGAPASIFTFSGLGYEFVPNDPVIITVNGQYIATISGSAGWFVFLLDTSNADDGLYMVHVQTPGLEKTEYFKLEANQPLRQPINTGPRFMIPAGSAFTNQKLLPVIRR